MRLLLATALLLAAGCAPKQDPGIPLPPHTEPPATQQSS